MSEIFLQRALEYIDATGIEFVPTKRLAVWRKWGLPDLRGFTPHLRQIRINTDDAPRFYSTKKTLVETFSESEKWLLHDLMHIIFYDFAGLHLGNECWQDRARFLEIHLASEALAVLTLDYHVVPGSLAVDFNPNDWEQFIKINPQLPQHTTFEFCDKLVNHYLTGAEKVFGSQFPVGRATKNNLAKYKKWLGHEYRYAEKQRYYTNVWHEDIMGKKPSHAQAVVENSAASTSVWEVINLLTDERYAEKWKNFTAEMSAVAKKETNYFDFSPKYRRPRKSYDFRFTDIESLSQSTISDSLKEIRPPNSSDLFLFWQILATVPPTLFKAKDRKAIQKMSLEAQSATIDSKVWKHLFSLCKQVLTRLSWSQNQQGLSTFFLP